MDVHVVRFFSVIAKEGRFLAASQRLSSQPSNELGVQFSSEANWRDADRSVNRALGVMRTSCSTSQMRTRPVRSFVAFSARDCVDYWLGMHACDLLTSEHEHILSRILLS